MAFPSLHSTVFKVAKTVTATAKKVTAVILNSGNQPTSSNVGSARDVSVLSGMVAKFKCRGIRYNCVPSSFPSIVISTSGLRGRHFATKKQQPEIKGGRYLGVVT